MPSEGFQQLIDRVISDEAFAQRLQTEPEAVLSEYQLTPDEFEALRSSDSAKLAAIGVDERVSKFFYH